VAAASRLAASGKYALTFDATASGAAVGAGFANGILGMQGPVAAAAARLAASSKYALNLALQVKSPSKVTEQIGRYFGQGLVVGMDSQRGAVGASAGSLFNLGSLDFASTSARTSAVSRSSGAQPATTGDSSVVAAIKALGDRFGKELDRQARTIQTMQRQMAGA
jgi:hypothetical protein